MKITDKIESGEINWDNVYDIKITEEEIPLLKNFSNLKDGNQQALKVNINSEFGALDNEYFIVNNRNISGSITFMGRLLNRLTGANIERYMKEKFGNGRYVIYQDTDSGYIHFEKVVNIILQENFGSTDFASFTNEQKKKAVDLMLDFIENEIQPIIDATVNFVLNKFNGFKKGFMGAKVEKIAKSGFWTAKKKYALLVLYDEGAYKIEKEKIAVTGIETVKSQTPDYAIEILEQALEIILKGTEKELQEFLASKKDDFFAKCSDSPQAVCEVVKINNLNYQEDDRGFYRITEDGRRIGAPMNSKAGMAYNRVLRERQLQEYYMPIEEGMKAYILKLKTPNPIFSEVVAFLDDGFLFDTGLVEYIDKDYLWERHIISPLKLIAESIDYSLENKAQILDDW